MLSAIRQKVLWFAFTALLSFLVLLNVLLASPVLAGNCGGTTSCAL
jgi:hypothetical protein